MSRIVVLALLNDQHCCPKTEWLRKSCVFFLNCLCFPPASGRTISVLQWADTEIWRAGWPTPDRNNKRRFNTSVNRRTLLSPNAEKWLNIGQIVKPTDISVSR